MQILSLSLIVVVMLAITACTPANANDTADIDKSTDSKGTTISVPQSISTVKVDADGNVLGNITINMRGTIDDTKADITIETPFDGLTTFWLATHEPDGIKGYLLKFDFADFKYCTLSATNSSNDWFFCNLAFSPDGDYWLFANDTSDIYYYGSVSGTATTEELIAYFAPLGVQHSRPA